MPTLRVHPSVVVSLSDSGCIAYHIDLNQIHRLNATAALLIELCDGGRSREGVLAAVATLMDEAGLTACSAWLDQALAQGLIVDHDVTPAPPVLTADRLTGLAKELRSKDRVLAAFICQQRAAELDPEDAQHWYALGELAHIVGRREESRLAYERYYAANPDDVEVKHLLIALRDEPPPTRASDPYIEQLYSYFAPFYDQNVVGDLDYRAPELLLAAITAAIEPPRPLNVLDLGCGTGLFGKMIRPMACRLTGVDLSQAMIDRAANRKIYDRLETAEITAWLKPAPTERYDLIAICDTLIYFGDLRQVIPQAARQLAPDGLLAFTVEQGDVYPFRLTDSGRFAHHRDHLEEVARECEMRIVSLTAQTLRHEYGRPVVGWVMVLGGTVR